MRIMWDHARRVGVLVATGHALFREQDITSRPLKLAIRTSKNISTFVWLMRTEHPVSSVVFYYEVEHVIEKANPSSDKGSGIPDKEIEDADERV